MIVRNTIYNLLSQMRRRPNRAGLRATNRVLNSEVNDFFEANWNYDLARELGIENFTIPALIPDMARQLLIENQRDSTLTQRRRDLIAPYQPGLRWLRGIMGRLERRLRGAPRASDRQVVRQDLAVLVFFFVLVDGFVQSMRLARQFMRPQQRFLFTSDPGQDDLLFGLFMSDDEADNN